jgi:hypothetical protein
MIKFILYIISFPILLLFVLAGHRIIGDWYLFTEARSVAFGSLFTIAAFCTSQLHANWTMVLLAFKSGLIMRNQDIRFSAAYLFRIKVDGKYFLIKGNKINQFQPVGGVFKRYEGSVELFDRLEIRDDNCIAITKTTRNDLRVRVKGKNLIRLVKWFRSKIDRETGQWREFSEELVQKGILSQENFPSIDYRFLYSNSLYLHYSKHYQCHELLLHEVYELMPNQSQEEELRSLLQKGENDQWAWVEEEKIKCLGWDSSIKGKKFQIGEHSNLLFDKKYKL